MGSVTGTESDSTLKMRLTPIFALIILSCLLLNFTSAQRSASRKTSKNCRGSSSRPSSSRSSSSRPSSSRGSTGGRGSTRCRPNVKPTTRTTSKATSITTSNNLKPTRRTTKNFQPKNQEEKPHELVPDRARVLRLQKLQAQLESQGYLQRNQNKTKQNQERQILLFLQLMWKAILFLQMIQMMKKEILFPVIRESKLQQRNI